MPKVFLGFKSFPGSTSILGLRVDTEKQVWVTSLNIQNMDENIEFKGKTLR
jgi:hypothetical protein